MSIARECERCGRYLWHDELECPRCLNDSDEVVQFILGLEEIGATWDDGGTVTTGTGQIEEWLKRHRVVNV